MDPFAAFSRIRILLVPVGSVPLNVFQQWANLVQSFETMPLSDVPPDSSDHKARFMPNAMSDGRLLLSYVSFPSPEWHEPLSLLRLSDFPLGVIGITDLPTGISLTQRLSEYRELVANSFPANSYLPLAASCFVFEDELATATNTENIPAELVVIPSVMGNKPVYLSTLVADLCSRILAGFSDITAVLESERGTETIGSIMFPTLSALRDLDVSKSLEGDGGGHVHVQTESENRIASPLSETAASRNSTPVATLARRTSSGISHQRISMNSTTSQIPKKRNTVNAGHGRLYKILGDLYLLAGRLADASLWLHEAIALFRQRSDNIWYAAALESMSSCITVGEWSSTQNPVSGDTAHPSKDMYTEIWNNMTLATSMYARITQFSGDASNELALVTLLFTEAVLRQCFLALSVWANGGWNLSSVRWLLNGVNSNDNISPESQSSDHKSEASGLSGAQIAGLASQAHGAFLLHLPHSDCVKVLSGLAFIYHNLGFKRKEAYILRETVSVIMDMILGGREETQAVARAGDIGLGNYAGAIHNSDSWIHQIGYRGHESKEGNDSLTFLMKYIANIYGVDLARLSVAKSIANPHSTSDNPARVASIHGWPELQVGVVREAVAFAEALPDLASAAQYSLSALSGLQSALDGEDQRYLYSVALRAYDVCRRRGDHWAVSFWLLDPLVEMTIVPPPSMLTAVENVFRDAGSVDSKPRDPFLYNPRRDSRAPKNIVVQGEVMTVDVRLWNPYSFDCEIHNLSLSVSGVPFHMTPVSVTLPALSVFNIRLMGTPLEPGLLRIIGCHMQLPVSGIVEVLIRGEEPGSASLSTSIAETYKVKYSGLDSRFWEIERHLLDASGKDTSTVQREITEIECRVVEAQPLIRITRASLNHGALMLFDGETTLIHLLVENISAIPVNFIELMFSDSTKSEFESAMSMEGSLSSTEMYEAAFEMKQRPVLQVFPHGVLERLEAGNHGTLIVSCLGKLKCVDGTIRLSYGYVPATAQDSNVFHTRHVDMPLLITVYRGLEVQVTTVNEYAYDLKNNLSKGSISIPNEDSCSGWCILSVEIRNFYGSPFCVSLRRIQKGTIPAAVDAIIPAGATSRISIPLKRIRLSQSEEHRPIPAPSGKPPIPRKGGSDKDATESTHFWYKEALLQAVECSWKEVDGPRSGELNLRHQPFTARMLKYVKMPTLELELRVSQHDTPSNQTGGSSARWNCREPCHVHIKIANLTGPSGPSILRLSIEPSNHVVMEGLQEGFQVPHLSQGDVYNISCRVWFLSSGRYRANAYASNINEDDTLGWNALSIDVAI